MDTHRIVTGGGGRSAGAAKLSGDHAQAMTTETFEQTSQLSKGGDESLRTENVDVAARVVVTNDRVTNCNAHAQLGTKSASPPSVILLPM